ncbi:ASCH domain-containing protein [Virgibacillus sp. C22-A2]|uniref:ASCH domain-containing protein n=1 Tax=Virgibacillus tibetensis TaxID=3042313 RepID=A0ABU6KD68_9BACI|nr:ASCH domain-containing protein [Virgibacillus sp. C22-A2]
MTKETNSLPPKTCTIEKLVTVADDIEKVINGQKTATRRNGIYADIGEVMVLKNHKFAVKTIYAQKLGDVTEENARQEGYQNLDEYKQSILSMHPGMKWLPDMNVWVHEYELVK